MMGLVAISIFFCFVKLSNARKAPGIKGKQISNIAKSPCINSLHYKTMVSSVAIQTAPFAELD